MTNHERLIREIAYDLWEQEGRPEGHSERLWLAAEARFEAEVAERRDERSEPPAEPAVETLPRPTKRKADAAAEKLARSVKALWVPSVCQLGSFKLVAAGMNPMDLKRGIDMAATAVVKDIQRRAKKVQSSDEIAQVGTISANGDKSIGKMIAEAMKKVGNEGVITVEEAKTAETALAGGAERRHRAQSPQSASGVPHRGHDAVRSPVGPAAFVILDAFGANAYLPWAFVYPVLLGVATATIGYWRFKSGDLE